MLETTTRHSGRAGRREGTGEYEAASSRTIQCLRRAQRTFKHLESAKAAADDLVRRIVQHEPESDPAITSLMTDAACR